MYNDRIALSIQDILEKEFKIALEKERKALVTENQELKQEIRNMKASIEAVKSEEKEITNVDLLRRISQLEKIILGKEQ